MPSEDYIWSPLSLTETTSLFHGLPIPWWLAGGMALDLFVGFDIRPHADIDVGIFRRDQLMIQDHLSNWDLHKTGPSGLRPWPKGEHLQIGVNQVWCRRTPDANWSLEIMFMEQEGDEWIFRRAPQVRGPIQGLMRHTNDGIPYLSPEIQLLFKARPEILDKDSLDFRAVLPHLDGTQIRWLYRALETTFPTGHPWINILRHKGE
jgi:hypothetical protein